MNYSQANKFNQLCHKLKILDDKLKNNNKSSCDLKYVGNEQLEKGEIVKILADNQNNQAVVQKINENPEFLSAIKAGGTSFEDSFGISVDSEGNSYITGYFISEATFGSLPSLNSSGEEDEEIFVAKVNNKGNWEWAIQAGGIFDDQGLGISVDCQGNSYVTGFFSDSATFGDLQPLTLIEDSDNIFVAKVSNTGEWEWAIQAGGTSTDKGIGISVDCQGNSYITGYFIDEATFINNSGNNIMLAAGNSPDIFVAKVSNTGTWEWAIQAGGTSFDEGLGISVDCQGNSYVTGYFRDVATFGDLPPLTSSSSNDIFVAKVSNTGDWLWVIQAGGGSFDEGLGISVDCQGNSYVTGYFRDVATFGDLPSLNSSGSNDIFVAKVSNTGEWLWAIQAGGTSSDEGYGISVDCQGNSYITGFFNEDATFGNITLNASSSTDEDIFVAKVNNKGDWLWAIQAGGPSYDSGLGISVDCTGNCYITGYFYETATFGSIDLTSNDSDGDIFVAKISSTNLNVVGINKTDSVGAGEVANVEFPGAVIIEDVSNEDLMPGFNYYVGCDNKLSKCCKCAKRFVGVACDNKKLITGVENGCKC